MSVPTVCMALCLVFIHPMAAFTQSGTSPDIMRMAANPTQGFHSPYLLYVPSALRKPASGSVCTILVIPNNTGKLDDDFAVHERSAMQAMEHFREWANRLKVVMLQPIFPRPKSQWTTYTQALDRDSLLVDSPTLKRPDLQLLSMLDHAAARLKAEGIPTDRRVLISGFSASGMFANRFTMLHPERVKGAAIGSPGGWPMAPLETWQGATLRYPVGAADLKLLVGRPLQLKALQQVPLLLFIGDQDTNDSVPIRDSFEKEDELLIFEKFGKTPVARWPHVERFYREQLPLAEVKLYPGMGHHMTATVIKDMNEFFGKILAKP